MKKLPQLPLPDMDLQIDRTLDAMRSAPVPGGLTERVAARFQQQSAHSVRPARRRSLVLLLPQTLCVTATVMAGVLIALKGHQPRRHPALTVSAPSPSVPGMIVATQSRTAPATGPASLLPARASTLHVERPSKIRVVAQSETDPAFLPSLLAPPMPLTEQERILRSLARNGRNEETAVLNPAVRSSQLAAATADYLAFFKAPPLLPETQQQLDRIHAKEAAQ